MNFLIIQVAIPVEAGFSLEHQWFACTQPLNYHPMGKGLVAWLSNEIGLVSWWVSWMVCCGVILIQLGLIQAEIMGRCSDRRVGCNSGRPNLNEPNQTTKILGVIQCNSNSCLGLRKMSEPNWGLGWVSGYPQHTSVLGLGRLSDLSNPLKLHPYRRNKLLDICLSHPMNLSYRWSNMEQQMRFCFNINPLLWIVGNMATTLNLIL